MEMNLENKVLLTSDLGKVLSERLGISKDEVSLFLDGLAKISRRYVEHKYSFFLTNDLFLTVSNEGFSPNVIVTRGALEQNVASIIGNTPSYVGGLLDALEEVILAYSYQGYKIKIKGILTLTPTKVGERTVVKGKSSPVLLQSKNWSGYWLHINVLDRLQFLSSQVPV